LGWVEGEGHGGEPLAVGMGVLGGFIAIPYILELEAKGNGRAIQVDTLVSQAMG